MRSLFAYLNVISLLYACASSAITTTTTTQSSIQKKSQGRGGGGGGILLLKQRAPIEESSIDYGSLRTCKHKSVCEARTLLTKPYHSFHFSSSASCYSLLPNFCGLNFPFRPTTIFFFFFFFAGWLADWGAWIIFFFCKRIAYRGKFARRAEQRLLARRWSIALIIARRGCVIMRMGRWCVVVRRLPWVRLCIRKKWLAQ